MNKTKNDKYLRKNRYDKNSKHKNKTRKVQRGGQGEGESGDTAVHNGRNDPPLGSGNPILSTNRMLNIPTEKEAVQPLNEDANRAKLQELREKQKKELEAQREAHREAEAPLATPEPAPATQKNIPNRDMTKAVEKQKAEPTQYNFANFKPSTGMGYSFGEQMELPQRQTAILAQPQPTAAEKAKTVPSSKPAPAPATKEERVERLKQEADDKKKMAEHSDPRFSLLAQTVPNWIMGKVSSVGHDSQVKLGEEIILTEFLNNIGNHIKQTKNQIKEVENSNELLLTDIKELNKKKTTDDLDKFNLYMKQIDYNNMFISKTLSDVRTTYEGAIKSGILQPMPEKSSSPGFFDKIKNRLKGNQKVPNEQNEKPSITQRFKQGFSNMGKTVKNAATSAKGAVTSRFSRKKNVNEDSQGIELQGLKNSNQEESTEPTSTEPTPADSTEENKTDNNEKSKTEQQEGDATNPKISMLDKGKQKLATMGAATKEGFAKMKTNVSNFFTRKKKTEDNSTELTPLAPLEPQAGGGNKTRKNRQYIREIKDNRAHLFNKEMEIINSIRNFKYGHTDEPKKQFLRAVKRG